MDKDLIKARLWAASQELKQVESALKESRERVEYCLSRRSDLRKTIRYFKKRLNRKKI